MNPMLTTRSSAEKTRWWMTSALTLLFISQSAIGCDISCEPETNRMTANQVENSAKDRPPVVFELGEPMPSMPAHAKVERRSYGGNGDVIEIKDLSRITIVTYEGQQIRSPTKLTKVFRNDQGLVETVYVWPLPRPMPWLDGVDWFKEWLKKNEVEPGKRLRKKLDIWSNNDIPGNEMPRNDPYQISTSVPLTPTSALSIRWKPHPVRDWVLVLGVGLTAEEMGKLREKEAADEDKDGEDE